MYNKNAQRHYRMIALLSIRGWLTVILIAMIGIVVAIFTPKTDPMDDQAIKNCEFVRQIYVVDTTNNGFRVSYKTIHNVTPERIAEIRNRKSVSDSFERLKVMAPVEFGNMLMLDIYDFADFAIRFDPADVRIHNIFVFGPDKEKLYVGKNPRIENWAKFINPGTAQGLLYITTKDIYFHGLPRRKVYRYFKCSGLNQISEYDEHFSHFSENERIY